MMLPSQPRHSMHPTHTAHPTHSFCVVCVARCAPHTTQNGVWGGVGAEQGMRQRAEAWKVGC